MKPDFVHMQKELSTLVQTCLKVECLLAEQSHLWSEDGCYTIADTMLDLRKSIADNRKRVESFKDSAISQFTLRKQ